MTSLKYFMYKVIREFMQLELCINNKMFFGALNVPTSVGILFSVTNLK